MGVSLDGESLTNAEIDQLLCSSNGLHLVRGRWVEVDRERLNEMLRDPCGGNGCSQGRAFIR
jgi:SNF2 Helicase protein